LIVFKKSIQENAPGIKKTEEQKQKGVNHMVSAVKAVQKLCNVIGREEELGSSLIAAKAGKHILLEGPVGVGKTTVAVAVASYLENKVIRIDGDERYTEQKLAGWFDPPLVLSRGYTNESFIHGPLSMAMEKGAIFLINELNRMPEGTQNVLLSAMDERIIQIPKFGKIEAKRDFMIISTQNPDEYVGTSQLSEALRDRFVCIDLSHQSEPEEREIARLRSQCGDGNIINMAVKMSRLTRTHPDIRRGSSIRGAIDLADIFHTAFGTFNGNVDNWTQCSKPAFLTKIELHDFSYEKFMRLFRKLAEKALAECKIEGSSTETKESLQAVKPKESNKSEAFEKKN
jgi:MoxR-like ATPase